MEDLFGVKMDWIMYVLLAVFLPALAVIGFMALRNRVMLKMALRNIPRRKAQTALIVAGIMISTLIMAASFRHRRHPDLLHSQGRRRRSGHH